MRAERGTAVDRPFAMGYVCVATTLGAEFEAFAELVGGDCAETYLVRTLQYAGLHSALEGLVRVAPAKFSRVVLTRAWDFVSDETGARVHAAFLESGICVPIEGSDARSERVPNASSEPVPNATANTSSERVPNLTRVAGARGSCPDSPDSPDPPTRAPAREAGEPQGGDSASHSANGNGAAKPQAAADPDELSNDDRVIATEIARALRGSSVASDVAAGTVLWDALREKSATPGQVRGFIDRWQHKPQLVAIVEKHRRLLRMTENGRRAGKK